MDSSTIYRRRWLILSVLIISLTAIVVMSGPANVRPATESGSVSAPAAVPGTSGLGAADAVTTAGAADA